MKQIDGHAMIARVKQLYDTGKVDLPYFNIVKESVQMEPPIEAIPVDWLNGIINNLRQNGNYEGANLISTAIDVWRGEIG